MRIRIISFTKGGSQICEELVKQFQEQGESCEGYVPARFWKEDGCGSKVTALTESVTEWSSRMFSASDALIYIGAVGIAVRSIAPHLKDKMTDPAVLVVDEQGNFVISLLSGHVGGANRLTERTAAILGAIPVITTASDVQGLAAVDVWAKEHDLVLSDRILAKKAAAELVNGGQVGFFSDFPVEEVLPAGYQSNRTCPVNLWVTVRAQASDPRTLRLIPKILTLGIGCRKGSDQSEIQSAVEQVFLENNLDFRAVRQAASIDLKQSEKGLLGFTESFHLPFATYTAGELEAVTGVFHESEFVRSITGVGNVCERAALLAAGTGACLLVKKTAGNGVTVAVAQSDYQVTQKKKKTR